MYSASPNSKRVEFRCPDPSANAYLAFAAMLMAGIDGIENRTDPGDPLDKNIYDLSPEEAKSVRQVPGSLEESLRALEEDHGCARIPGSSTSTSTSDEHQYLGLATDRELTELFKDCEPDALPPLGVAYGCDCSWPASDAAHWSRWALCGAGWSFLFDCFACSLGSKRSTIASPHRKPVPSGFSGAHSNPLLRRASHAHDVDCQHSS